MRQKISLTSQWIRIILFSLLLFCACTEKSPSEKSKVKESVAAESIGHDFIAILETSGVVDACKEMGIDFNTVFVPAETMLNNPYLRYRWSVSKDEHGNTVIHALPPEEEMGWTPWERWSLKNNKPIHTEWVLYPIKQPIERDIIRWYKLEVSDDLVPRFLHEADDLSVKLRLARVDVAAKWLGMDVQETFIDPLQPEAQKIYAKYRWVVIPHVLAQDGPVIYALPPANKTDDWPWESWYTDGRIAQIHHIHFTEKKTHTSGKWMEGPGAPERPPEIFGLTWYWYDDPDMTPYLSTDKNNE